MRIKKFNQSLHRPRTKIALIAGAVVLVAIVTAAVGISVLIARHNHKSPQSELPFTDLKGPTALAVDSAGGVYVVDELGRQVLRLAAGSTTLSVLPIQAPSPDNPSVMTAYPAGVAVDGAGDVYVTDSDNDRVLKLATGSTTPAVLPFTDLKDPKGLAVDSAGDVYVAESSYRNPRVLKLAAGATAQTVLPFSDLKYVNGVAVDNAGDVYIADSGNNRVLKLAVGATTQTVLPFSKLNGLGGIAVDSAGDVYVADRGNFRVLKLAAGATAQTVLPFTGLWDPAGVAVDTAGNVYVADFHKRQVVELKAQ